MMEEDIPELIPIEDDNNNVDEWSTKSKVPVTIITGFLGSGKTTFLRNLVESPQGKKIAIIQNEYSSDLSLERAMVLRKPTNNLVDLKNNSTGSQIQDWIELPNGCVCCTAKDNLVLALEALVSRKKNLDYIFIETTGLANPGPLATALWVDNELESSIYLDSIIVFVDVKNIAPHLEPDENLANISDEFKNFKPCTEEAQKQISMADVIVLNKIDLVKEFELEKIFKLVRSINSLAPCYKAERSNLEIEKLTDIRAYSNLKIEKFIQDIKEIDNDNNNNFNNFNNNNNNNNNNNSVNSNDNCSDSNHKDNLVQYSSTHINRISKVCLKNSKSFRSLSDLNLWLARIMWDEDIPIYRIKGQISIVNDENRYILQGVYKNFEVLKTPFLWGKSLPEPTLVINGNNNNKDCDSDLERSNKIIIIGPNLDENYLRSTFDSLFISKE